MEILNSLSPAVVHLIQHESKAELKDLVKFTFMDLMLKKVLESTTVRKQHNKRDRVRTYNYTVAGKIFRIINL